MKRVYLSLIASFTAAWAITVSGQIPSATPTDDRDVVRISTNLVQLDVTVTDKNGKVVTDLAQDEIEVFENGKRQKLSNFLFVPLQVGADRPSTDTESAVAARRRLTPEQVSRSVAIAVDTLSLSFESTVAARRAIRRFVDEQMQPGDLVAIVRTGDESGVLQQFTNDKRLLLAAADRIKWTGMGSGGVTAIQPVSSFGYADDKDMSELKDQLNAASSIRALKHLINGLAQLPGRKSMILFSDGPKFSAKDTGEFDYDRSTFPLFRMLADHANRASVTIYTVDPRGLQYTGPTSRDDLKNMPRDTPGFVGSLIGARNLGLLGSQQGLRILSEQTGGLSIRNTNDLAGGIRQMLADQSYYLIGYIPDVDTIDVKRAKFYELEVKVRRPGMTVRHRAGFIRDPRLKARSQAATTAERLAEAVSSPFGFDNLRVRFAPLVLADEANRAALRTIVHVNANDLVFTDAGSDQMRADLTLFAVAFGDNGRDAARHTENFSIVVPKNEMPRLFRDGFTYVYVMPLKKPGPYLYRVALLDAASGQVGSTGEYVSIPDLSAGKLHISDVILESTVAGRQDDTASNALRVTALRQVESGKVLHYSSEVYNSSGNANVTADVTILYEGKVVSEKKGVAGTASGTATPSLRFTGALGIGSEMPAGEYVLRLVVSDKAPGRKAQAAMRLAAFEVIK